MSYSKLRMLCKKNYTIFIIVTSIFAENYFKKKRILRERLRGREKLYKSGLLCRVQSNDDASFVGW